jgi:hypothetical protein
MTLETIYADLLARWCDGLLALQLTHPATRNLRGGILCPACGVVHGRSTDALYPFLCMAHRTGDERYLDAAILSQNMLDTLTDSDGGFTSELSPAVEWKGCTVFSMVALAEALRHHGSILPDREREKWLRRLRTYSDYVYDNHTMETGDTNYPITTSLAMTLAGQVLEDPRYTARGREFARASLAFFTEPNRLILGEGGPRPMTGTSPRGCRAVDLGYNVEESLPAYALYAVLSNDAEVLEAVVASLRSHLEFMLPDGGWDNSWGSRNYKWTYWGSRTSDGSSPALLLLAGHDPHFAEAALRNTRLLEACTHDGLLHGGPHYHAHGELPCSHHTFCHAKALATVLDHLGGREIDHPAAAIPRDSAYGLRQFSEILTWLVAVGPWRATVTACDWENLRAGNATGGALTMLWHRTAGPVLSASMTEYQPHEPTCMQRQREPDACLTARIEMDLDGRRYWSINDPEARVQTAERGSTRALSVEGELADRDYGRPTGGRVPFRLGYAFSETEVLITASVSDLPAGGRARYVLPVIAPNDEEAVQPDDQTFTVSRPGGTLRVSASQPATQRTQGRARVFNVVPGFETVPLLFELGAGRELRITLTFREA